MWHGNDIGLWQDTRLTSPVFTVDGSGSFNMQFDHSFGFEFDGGGNYDGGVGATRTQVVNQASTSTALSATPNPSSATESVTFTATVTSGVAGTIGAQCGQRGLGIGHRLVRLDELILGGELL